MAKMSKAGGKMPPKKVMKAAEGGVMTGSTTSVSRMPGKPASLPAFGGAKPMPREGLRPLPRGGGMGPKPAPLPGKPLSGGRPLPSDGMRPMPRGGDTGAKPAPMAAMRKGGMVKGNMKGKRGS